MPAARAHSKRPRNVAPSKAANDDADEVIQTSFRLPRSRWTKLQQLGIEERQSIQSLIITALEAEFEKRGKNF